jgi:hypothetical protein
MPFYGYGRTAFAPADIFSGGRHTLIYIGCAVHDDPTGKSVVIDPLFFAFEFQGIAVEKCLLGPA